MRCILKSDLIPHACFRFTPPRPSTGEPDLKQALESGLRDEFETVRIVNFGPLATLAVVLGMGEKSVTAALGNSKFETSEWILIVGSTELSSRQKATPSPELETACRKIHAVLAVTPGVSATRWYFEGPNSQSNAVSTPDELAWPSQGT